MVLQNLVPQHALHGEGFCLGPDLVNTKPDKEGHNQNNLNHPERMLPLNITVQVANFPTRQFGKDMFKLLHLFSLEKP